MGRLGKYIRPYWGYILLTVLIKTVASVMDLFLPYLMEMILDGKVPAGDPGKAGGVSLHRAAVSIFSG